MNRNLPSPGDLCVLTGDLFPTRFLFVALLSAVFFTSVQAQPQWQMFHKDAQRSGFANVVGPQTANLKWKYYVDKSGGGPSSVAVSSIGTVYVGSHDSITAIDKYGHRKWSRHYPGVEGPAISNDEKTIYFPSLKSVVALDSAGGFVWQTPVSDTCIFGVALSADGSTVYQGCWDKNVYAFNTANGNIRWTYTTRGSVSYPVTLDNVNNLVIIGGGDSHRIPDSLVYAIHATTGLLAWKYNTRHTRSGSATLAPNGLLYIPSEPQLIVLNPANGAFKWAIGGPNDSAGIITPVVLADTTIYLGTSTGYMMEFNGTTHHTNWTYLTGPEPGITPAFYGMIGFPVVDNQGMLYEGSVDYNMYALDKHGNFKWKYTTGGVISEASPALGTDGTLYFGSGDGYVYAIRDLTTGIAPESQTMNPDVQVFPNPSEGIFRVIVGPGQELTGTPYTLEIYNLVGEVVIRSASVCSPVSIQLDLSSQPGGMYFLKVSTGKGNSVQRLIIR